MKETRASLALLLFIIAGHIAYFLPQANTRSELSQSYAITTCPGSVNQAKSTALLPTKQIGIRELIRKKADFYRPTSGTPVLARGAIIVAGNPRNSWVIQSKAGKWTSAATCISGSTNSWFVGGTGDVTSQGKVVLANSGLSDAVAEVSAFSENGPREIRSVTVKALSEREIRLDALDPGSERLVIRVKVISGRLTSFLIDERVRGLNNLGGDFVAPIQDPNTELVIPAVPSDFGIGSKVSHILRILSTEDLDTNLSVEVISRDGVYVPVDLGNIAIRSGEVLDIPLQNLQVGKGQFAIKLQAAAPIVAGIFTEVRRGNLSDFMWSAAAPAFDKVSFNIYGLEPVITFVGDQVTAEVEWRLRDGKVNRKTLVGQEIVNWKVPANTRLLTISNQSQANVGMSWASADGVTSQPIYSAATLESAARPVADISVIQP